MQQTCAKRCARRARVESRDDAARRELVLVAPTDSTGFNKMGYVTETGVVIYPRRSRIARKSIDAVMKQPHQILQNAHHPRAKEVEVFFTNNVINTAMFTTAMQLLVQQPESRF